MLNERALIQQRSSAWIRLEVLSRNGGSRLKRLTGEEVAEFMKLYRQASADLSTLSANGSNPEVAAWLNALVARCYGQVYRAPMAGAKDMVVRSLWIAADTVRRRWLPLVSALVLFFLMAGVGAVTVTASPEARNVLVPAGFEPSFEAWKSGTHEAKSASDAILATAFYAQNNPLVAIRTNALTVATFGVFGVAALWQNGGLLGILAMEVAREGHLGFLIVSIAPHGVSELGGIFVACGAGFLLGGVMIRPGRLTRTEALRRVGKDAAVLAILSLVMIFLAAPIEGFFSFNPDVPNWAKAGFALLALAGWLSYFIGFGRSWVPAGSTVEELRPEPLE